MFLLKTPVSVNWPYKYFKNFSVCLFSIVYCVCMCIHCLFTVCTCAFMEGRGQLLSRVDSFLLVYDPWDQVQVISLGDRHLYPVSHLVTLPKYFKSRGLVSIVWAD